MYQSVPIITRQLGEDVIIEGRNIPAGTNVILCKFILHRDPEIFPNPDTFHPDRFLPENSEQRNPYDYVPFSAGPRNCIGQKYKLSNIAIFIKSLYFRFALMEEKILISSILRKYNLRSNVKPSEIPLMAELILRPKNGIYVSLEKR